VGVIRRTEKKKTRLRKRAAARDSSEQAPSFDGLLPASAAASSSKRRNTSKNTCPEVLLRKSLSALGYRFRLHSKNVRGRPDILFGPERIALFCDGDFWHGRNWKSRRVKLAGGHNAAYWIAKIEANMRRDLRIRRALRREGWTVIRLWEGEIRADPLNAALKIGGVVNGIRAVESRQSRC
jgi:DNA mismatch endonuclease (patch repair protein)